MRVCARVQDKRTLIHEEGKAEQLREVCDGDEEVARAIVNAAKASMGQCCAKLSSPPFS